MTKLTLIPIVLVTMLPVPCGVSAQALSTSQNGNSCFAAIGSIGQNSADTTSLRALHSDIENALKQEPLAADLLFRVAEMMKRTGDYRARVYYEKTIAADPHEPCYESFYADYLRNFRGARIGLLPNAEQHYFQARLKLKQRHDPSFQNADQQTKDYVDRGLSALYQRDGIVVFSRRDEASVDNSLERPLLFFSTIDRFSDATADLDREADVRDYTSEAMLSAARMGKPLTIDQFGRLIRMKRAVETLDRIRLRYKTLPAFDVFYTHRQTANAQVTNFKAPDIFNDVPLSQYGIRGEKPFVVGGSLDATIVGNLELDRRFGLVETKPDAEEGILSYQVEGTVSHFIGPDKITTTVSAAHQSIHEHISPSALHRLRNVTGTNVTYSIFRDVPFLKSVYDKRFETRGWDFAAGILTDTEAFPPATVKRRDYFVGTSLKGVWRFDFTLQPTWYTSTVDTDLSQKNSQYRTYAAALFRIVDEERNGGVPETHSGLHVAFVHLVVPFRQDVALTGDGAFENSKRGVELDVKLFSYCRA